jgi:hypothetical protein
MKLRANLHNDNGIHIEVMDVGKSFVEYCWQELLYRMKPERKYDHLLNGYAEANLIALVCSAPPAG